jgi:hypothetical protein
MAESREIDGSFEEIIYCQFANESDVPSPSKTTVPTVLPTTTARAQIPTSLQQTEVSTSTPTAADRL